MLDAAYIPPYTSATALNKFVRYPENLSKIIDSANIKSSNYGRYTKEQILDAAKKLDNREYLAFGYLSNDTSVEGIKSYAEAFLKYINKLSPEEQSGTRYNGTKEAMTTLLAMADAELATESPNPSKKNVKLSSALILLLEETMKMLRKNGVDDRSTIKTDLLTEKVTISDTARKLSLET